MPLNMTMLLGDIERISKSHPDYKRAQINQVQLAVKALQSLCMSAGELIERIESATSQRNRIVRSGGPLLESVTEVFGPPTELKNHICCVGVDGSHALPDIQEYAVVNISAVSCRIDDEENITDLSYETATYLFADQDMLNPDDDYLYEDDITLERAIKERELLGEVMSKKQTTLAPDEYLVGMLDGTINVWRPRRNESDILQHNRAQTFEIFEVMRRNRQIYLAYLDTPAADQVIQMLRITSPIPSSSISNDERRPRKAFTGIRDRDLFFEILPPGYRSAVFRLFGSNPDELQVCFFYINVATTGKPVIARIELAEWVASNPEFVAIIHHVVLNLCSVIPGITTPFVLIRSDEEAWIKSSDRAIVEQLLRTHIEFDAETIIRPKTVGKILTRGWHE